MRTITPTSSAVPTQNRQVVDAEANAAAVVPITGSLQGRDVEEIITPGARNIGAQDIGVRSIGVGNGTNTNPANTDPSICGRRTPILALSVDVIAYILQFASLRSHASFMQACKAFEEMARKYSSIPVAIGRIQNVKSSDPNQEGNTPWEVYSRLMAELQRVPQVMHAVFQTDLVCFRYFHVEAEQNPLHLQAAMREFSRRYIDGESIEEVEGLYLQYKLCATMLGISAYESNQHVSDGVLEEYNNVLNGLGLSTQPTNSNSILMRMCEEPIPEIASTFIQSQVVDAQSVISLLITDPILFDQVNALHSTQSLKSDPTFILELLTATTKCTEEQTRRIFMAEWTTRWFNPVVMEQRAFYLAAAAIDSEYCRETFSFANAPARLQADPDFCLEMLLRDILIFPEIPTEVCTPEFMEKLKGLS